MNRACANIPLVFGELSVSAVVLIPCLINNINYDYLAKAKNKQLVPLNMQSRNDFA